MKNPKTIRSKEVFAIAAERRLFLTGTPILNRPVEIHPVAAALSPDEFGDFWAFARRYCGLTFHKGKPDYSGASNLGELNRRLRSTIMVRRRKEDVLVDLPPKRRKLLSFPADEFADVIGEEQKEWVECCRWVEELQREAELTKAAGSQNDYKAAVKSLREGVLLAFQRISKMRHKTALAKVPLVVERVKELLGETSSVVAFAYHLDVIEAIAGHFPGAVSLTGRLLREKQQYAVDTFQNNQDCRVFVGSFKAQGLATRSLNPQP